MRASDAYKDGLLIGASVEILPTSEEFEINMDAGMLGRVVSVENVGTTDEACLCVTLDVREYEEYNKERAQPTFYDRSGVACLKWHESDSYPRDRLERIYSTEDVLDKIFMVAPPQHADAARNLQEASLLANLDFVALAAAMEKIKCQAMSLAMDHYEPGMTREKTFRHFRHELETVMKAVTGRLSQEKESLK